MNRYHFKNVKTADEVIAERKEGLLLNPICIDEIIVNEIINDLLEERDKKMIETYKKAIEIFGKESQIDMAIEEMSELTKALLKLRRAVKSGEMPLIAFENVNEEMADVSIMLEQLYLIFNNRKDVTAIINKKTDRLAERIKERRGE